MPRNKTAVSDLGSVYAHGTEFRAHINVRDDAGEQKNIYGPSRGSQNEAQKDLDQIRVAGGVGATREEGIKLCVCDRSGVAKNFTSQGARRLQAPEGTAVQAPKKTRLGTPSPCEQSSHRSRSSP